MFTSVLIFYLIDFLIFLFFLWLLFFIFLFICSLFFSLFNLFWGQFDFFFFFIFLFIFRSIFFDLLWSVLKIESGRKLEIKLACSALMLSSESIEKFEINFRSIKSTISFINFVLFSKLIKCVLKLWLSNIPFFKLAQIFFRSGWEFNFVFKPKDRVNVINEVKNTENLIFNLFRHTENMSIILLESSDSCKSWQSTF